MRSDIIKLTSEGVGVDEALKQAEAVAAFKALPKKQAIHLRLLTEEMMGMMQALTGEREADFWIEDEDLAFTLHLRTATSMNADLRKKLLSASTTGKNAAAKGIIGKLRELFERMSEPSDSEMPDIYAAGFCHPDAGAGAMAMVNTAVWSFNRYKESLENRPGPKEDWDELERSVIANIADEIKIGIRDNTVEMIVYKKF